MLDRAANTSTVHRGVDLRLNPFVLLGVALAATPKDVDRAYEDAVEAGASDNDLLQRARQVLLTPMLRIDAEIGGFFNISPDLAAQLVAALESRADAAALSDLARVFHPLPKSNVLAHIASLAPARAYDLLELVQAQAAVEPNDVYQVIKAVREQAGIVKVELQAVIEALLRHKERQSKAAVETLLEDATYADTFAAFVRRTLASGRDRPIANLDIYVRSYSSLALPDLSRRHELVTEACNAIRADPTNREATGQLLAAIQRWNEIGEPLQIYENHVLRDEPLTREIYEEIRSLCIRLNDKHEQYGSALAITRACADIFKAPRNLRAQEQKAAVRSQMEKTFAAQNWRETLALIDQLLAVEADVKKADALRTIRETCRSKLNETANTKAEEAAQNAYKGAAGRRDNVLLLRAKRQDRQSADKAGAAAHPHHGQHIKKLDRLPWVALGVCFLVFIGIHPLAQLINQSPIAPTPSPQVGAQLPKAPVDTQLPKAPVGTKPPVVTPWPPVVVEPPKDPVGTPSPLPTAAPKNTIISPSSGTIISPSSGTLVFPSMVDPKYSNETAGKGRMHTCIDQYNTNKATNANGGMKWIQKGGGYYSECTQRLKG